MKGKIVLLKSGLLYEYDVKDNIITIHNLRDDVIIEKDFNIPGMTHNSQYLIGYVIGGDYYYSNDKHEDIGCLNGKLNLLANNILIINECDNLTYANILTNINSIDFRTGFIQAMYDARNSELHFEYIENCLQSMQKSEYEYVKRLVTKYWETGDYLELEKIANRFYNVSYQDLANCF